MKKVLLAAALLGASVSAQAVAPGGPGCGWGNLIFEGKSGMPVHLLATIVNGTSGNATFGMTSGTNGCDTNGALTYSGESLLSMNGVLEEVAQDMATGEGEALTALSVSIGVSGDDRAYFNSVMHENFASIFPRQDVSAGEVMQQITAVMQNDQKLAKYV
ncbi:MAG: DUF3015 domain-containing protein [Alloalcanivorax venustensis]|nr:DUF3015 domain-containing protein [Alloalcanivorax venustensis]KXJ48088.1 MAG: hypothetical protein AXW13_02670 [Alcanivorax sp. Nap_24]MAK22433.1 hypothetical protein [Alcanivorax sp.]MCH9782844.1 DUF3015 domain-containing protein [Gammaproteobacteria bacterium]MEC8880057.1 DUF3015 domain-containing protein [Pseudomonadota bacterium]MAQ35489.1 hypothetical protein [Alcanivorax sp.]